MRMIGSIGRDSDAERFSDYLVAQNIPNMVEETQAGGTWSVWVENDDDVDRGKAELDAFLSDPAAAKYDARSAAQKVRAEEQQKRKKRRAKVVDVRTNWAGVRQAAPLVTIALMLFSVIVTLGTGSMGVGRRSDRPGPLGQPRWEALDMFMFTSTFSPRYAQWRALHGDAHSPAALAQYWWQHLRAGEVWRLITPIFPHLGILHLLFNMLWMRDLGFMVEARRGPKMMVLLVLATAVISNIAQYFWTGPGIASGMSGVVYGLFGYVWIKQRFEPHLGLGMREQVVWMMTAWLFICMTGWVGPIANAAHVMGLISGAMIGYLPIAWRRAQRQMRS